MNVDFGQHFGTLVRGFVLVALMSGFMFGLKACFEEDHRHSEEMKRYQLIEAGCMELE